MLLHPLHMEGHSTQPSMKNGPPLAGHGAQAVRDAIAESSARGPATTIQGWVRFGFHDPVLTEQHGSSDEHLHSPTIRLGMDRPESIDRGE